MSETHEVECERCVTVKLVAKARVLGLTDIDPIDLLRAIADDSDLLRALD